MNKNYDDAIKTMVKNGKDELDRGDIIIKEMSRLTQDLLDYRYTVNHYEGNQKGVYSDKISTIKNTLSILLGDIDMYMEYVGIADKVDKKKKERIIKLAEKIER